MIEKIGEADSVDVDPSVPPYEGASADETQAKTRDRVSKLLAALGIEVVIAVDDIHYSGGEGDSAEVTESMAGAPDLLSSIVELLRLDATHLDFGSVDETDPAAVSDFINANWTGFSADLRSQLLGAVRTLQKDREENVEESEIAHDVKAQGALRAVFDGVVEFMQMSMTEWNAGWRELLADDRKYLVLIDRTFNREQHGGEETGDEILGELLSAQLDSVWAGLFTRHARDEDGERDLTKALREKHPDQANRVAAIGKFRTTSIALLPAGLRALLLVRELNAYRELAKGALSTAGESASKQFELLSDYAIVEAIAAAQEEGTFELEHPLRLAQRLFAHALAREVRSDLFARDNLEILRNGSVGAFRNADTDHAQVRELRRADTFEPDGHINELGLSLEIGDVFKFESVFGDGEPRHYVLLGQACDLSVRGKGVRTPDLRTVILHRVMPEALPGVGPTKHGLGYLESHSDQRWVVDLRAAYEIVVSIDILDATVFSRTGESMIALEYSEQRPMAQSWLERQKILQKKAKKAISQYRALESQVQVGGYRDTILRMLAAELGCGSTNWRTGPTVQIDIENDVVRYGVTRVGRIRSDTASRVADLAARYRSRPAFEANLVADEPATV